MYDTNLLKLEMTGVEPMTDILNSQKLRLYGQIEQMSFKRKYNDGYDNYDGSKKKKRSKKQWIKAVKKDKRRLQ